MIKLMTLLPRLQDKLSTQFAAHNHEADNRKGYADGHIYTTLVLARLFQSTSINQLQELAADLFPFSSLVFLCFYSLTGMNNGAGGVEQAVAGRLPAVSLRRAQWRLADERCELQEEEMEYVRRFHHHEPGSNQCNSFVAKHVRAPLHTVWSLVRRFDQPQLFKPFIRKCVMRGNIDTGSVREVIVQSGLPATRSMERLEFLDDNEHILRVKFIDGDHMLKNYTSTLTVHSEVIDGQPGTLVIESFVVDIPEGNTKDDICYFVENLLRCNLRTLADVTEKSLAGP